MRIVSVLPGIIEGDAEKPGNYDTIYANMTITTGAWFWKRKKVIKVMKSYGVFQWYNVAGFKQFSSDQSANITSFWNAGVGGRLCHIND